eukprot:10265112-Ditylum_brightwellii.AAC.1
MWSSGTTGECQWYSRQGWRFGWSCRVEQVYGVVESNNKCSYCDVVSSMLDPYKDIMLDVTQPPCQLQENCLTPFQKKERLSFKSRVVKTKRVKLQASSHHKPGPCHEPF